MHFLPGGEGYSDKLPRSNGLRIQTCAREVGCEVSSVWLLGVGGVLAFGASEELQLAVPADQQITSLFEKHSRGASGVSSEDIIIIMMIITIIIIIIKMISCIIIVIYTYVYTYIIDGNMYNLPLYTVAQGRSGSYPVSG